MLMGFSLWVSLENRPESPLFAAWALSDEFRHAAVSNMPRITNPTPRTCNLDFRNTCFIHFPLLEIEPFHALFLLLNLDIPGLRDRPSGTASRFLQHGPCQSELLAVSY